MRRTSGVFGKMMDRLKKLSIYALAILIIGIVVHFFGVHVPMLSDVIDGIL